jgi:hypothetical protein
MDLLKLGSGFSVFEIPLKKNQCNFATEVAQILYQNALYFPKIMNSLSQNSKRCLPPIVTVVFR